MMAHSLQCYYILFITLSSYICFNCRRNLAPKSIPEKEGLFCKINNLLRNPRLEYIVAVFEMDAYIRLNRVYLSPFSLRQFLVKLTNLD